MRDKTSYYLFRIRLEKLKQKTWTLIVVSRFLVFLAVLLTYAMNRT